MFFPLGPKQFEATATWPIEAFWQRPRRIAAAQLDAERIAENLVQNGLNLVRDVKVAHTDMLLAEENSRLANEVFRWRGEFAELTEARLRAGDISELEANVARSQARMAEVEAGRRTHEVAMARERLRFLLGMGMDKTSFQVLPSLNRQVDPGSFDELLTDAFASRPDLRAAEIAMQAAGERAGWEESKILNLSTILDINGEGREGFEAGPGMLVEIPIFDTNQGGRARSSAEIEQTARRYLAVQHLIASEVRQAMNRYSQAAEALRLWQSSILPPLEESLREAESAYAAGDVSYLSVVDSTLKLVEARMGQAAAAADLRRANAELDRSIGRSRVEKL
jgi:cobalt-zinc-cadmium efflux system outer membrane protein